MDDCIFCKIVKGEIPSHKIYEDEHVIAFLDINPLSEGHTLVVPKKHSKNFLEMEKDNVEKLFAVVQKVAKAIKKSINAEGLNISTNIESAAGQVVMHTHIHVFPRWHKDEYSSWERNTKLEKKMEEIQKNIVENIK